ncbi:MAG TPA: hypothetical protein VE010_03375, partial [Thermoanaerobaculia bacterium]|nr:hypothetical protein [Thermoanaerobaculia bacterium]
IDGYEVVPEIDIHTCGADYRTLLKKALAELPDADRNLSVASRRDALERGEPIRDTIVKGLKQNGERNVALRNEANHVIAAPGFGTIHFGELLVKRGRRRVNLLRFDFGDRHDRGPKKKYQLHSDQQHAETYTVDADQLNDETPEHRMMFLAQTSSMRPDSGSLTIASGDGNGEPVWPGRNG